MKDFLLSTSALTLCILALQAPSFAGGPDSDSDIDETGTGHLQATLSTSDPFAEVMPIVQDSAISHQLHLASQSYGMRDHLRAARTLGILCEIADNDHLLPKHRSIAMFLKGAHESFSSLTKDAQSSFRYSIAIKDETGRSVLSEELISMMLTSLGNGYRLLGQELHNLSSDAREHLRSVPLHPSTDMQRMMELDSLGSSFMGNDCLRALKYLEESLGIEDPSGDHALISEFKIKAHMYIGSLKISQGDIADTVHHFEKALLLSQGIQRLPVLIFLEQAYHMFIAIEGSKSGNLEAVDLTRRKIIQTLEERVLLKDEQGSALLSGPKLTDIYARLGISCAMIGNYDKAIPAFEEALYSTENPTLTGLPRAQSLHNLSQAYIKTQNPDVLPCIQELLELKDEGEEFIWTGSNRAYSYFDLGTIYGYLKDLPKSAQFFTKALNLKENGMEALTGKKRADAYNLLGHCQAEQGNPELAIDAILNANSIPGDNDGCALPRLERAMTLNTLGCIFCQGNNFPEAIQVYTLSLQTLGEEGTPEFRASTWQNLGRAYKQLGNKEKYNECFAKAAEISLGIDDEM